MALCTSESTQTRRPHSIPAPSEAAACRSKHTNTLRSVSSRILSVIPSLNALPSFLSSTGYKNPSDESNTAFNKAFDTPLLYFPYIKDRPEYMAAAGQYMGVWRDGQTSWLNVYRFEDEVKHMVPVAAAGNVSASAEEEQRILFVDVGGALGQQCRALRKKFPHLKGRVISQDLAAMLDARTANTDDDGVEFMVHDFFQPQDKLGREWWTFLSHLTRTYFFPFTRLHRFTLYTEMCRKNAHCSSTSATSSTTGRTTDACRF